MMDLQQQAQIVAGIRAKFQESIGDRCFVRVNLGRSRINENTGTIRQAHPKVFIVELEYRRGRTAMQSFQYSDILTGVVEVYQHHELMFGPFEIDPDAPLVSPEKRPVQKKRLRPVKPFEQRIRLSSDQVAMIARRLREESRAAKGSAPHNRELVEELSRKFDKKMKLDSIVSNNVSATADEGSSLADIEEKIIGAINGSAEAVKKAVKDEKDDEKPAKKTTKPSSKKAEKKAAEKKATAKKAATKKSSTKKAETKKSPKTAGKKPAAKKTTKKSTSKKVSKK